MSTKRQREAAEILHEIFCRWNHTDGCAWWYENDRKNPWEEHAHKRYLNSATELLMKFNDAQGTFVNVLKWLKQFREEGKLH